MSRFTGNLAQSNSGNGETQVKMEQAMSPAPCKAMPSPPPATATTDMMKVEQAPPTVVVPAESNIEVQYVVDRPEEAPSPAMSTSSADGPSKVPK